MAAFTFTSADGTRIRGWRNEGIGVPVVISNGLGTPPEAWPTIGAKDSGFRVCTWYYRGTGGSDRPADRSRISVQDHMADLEALMDHEGMSRAIIVCWSLGVNVGFELAERRPERVAGLLAVAGVPGGTFQSMLGPVRLPRRVRQAIGVNGARLLRLAGPAMSFLFGRIPLTPRTAAVIRHSRLMTPAARPEVLLPALAEFQRHDFRWYFSLAIAAAAHQPMDVSFVRMPTMLVAGRHDLVTSMHDMVAAAERIPHAELVVLPGSHFLPLEYPDELAERLRWLAEQTDLVRSPLTGAQPT